MRTDAPLVALFMIDSHRLGGRQYFVIVPKHPFFCVLLMGPADRIEIATSLNNDRLIEGKPLFDSITVTLEGDFGITGI